MDFLKIMRDIAIFTKGDCVFFEYNLRGFIFKRENGKIRFYEGTDRDIRRVLRYIMKFLKM